MSARRSVTHRAKCADPTCREWAHFDYNSQRERAEHFKELARRPWRCVRHIAPHEVLSEDNTERVHVLVAKRIEGLPDHLFWLQEDAERGGNGFVHGPGFKAYAKDFPVGTRLVVTVRAELPKATR